MEEKGGGLLCIYGPFLIWRSPAVRTLVPTFHITIMVPRFRTCSTGI
jgi:hypothetical protein